MNVRSMQYITAIAQEGTLSSAGKKLGVSQPTLSAFLSGLESELGMDLFLREKKKLVLTPAGLIYLDAATRILKVKDQTYQSIYQLTHEATETIVIGATPLRGSIMIAQIFPQFSKRFPHVKLEIREAYMGELRSLAKNNEVNLSLGSCYDSEDPELDCIIISKEEVILGVPAFHPLAHMACRDPVKLSAIDIVRFNDSPFVLLAPGTTVRTISDNIFSIAGFRPTVVFETNNNLVLSNMLRQGVGVGFLPRSAMVADADDIVYFSLNPKYYLALSIFASKNRMLTEAERYFAYLVIKKDRHNPLYVSSRNTCAWNICKEFESEENL